MSASEAARAAIALATNEWRTVPHWMDRAAAGVMHVTLLWLQPSERAKINQKRHEINKLREIRAKQRAPSPARQKHETMILWRGIHVQALYSRTPFVPCYGASPCRVAFTTDRYAGVWRTPREAVQHMLRNRHREYGPDRVGYYLRRDHRDWKLCARLYRQFAGDVATWPHRPKRHEIAAAIRRHRFGQKSRVMPDTLGWRAWLWNGTALVSPHHATVWDAPELRVEQWSDSHALRGESGIHARRMPRNWRLAGWQYNGHQEGPCPAGNKMPLVTGIVERFGRYVLGTEGWRAEWVMIRELMAPDVPTMLALIRTYPEVRVHLSHTCAAQAAEETSCA